MKYNTAGRQGRQGLHRDNFLAKVPGLVSADSATNVYSLNRRAVVLNRHMAVDKIKNL